MKMPYIKLYVRDWLSETLLRLCSPGARGLWIDMMCLMAGAERYGYLDIMGKKIESDTLAKLTCTDKNETAILLKELEEYNVFSIDEDGYIFSRRMVQDNQKRKESVDFGSSGGNPDLKRDYNKPGNIYAIIRPSDNAIKIGIAKNVNNRLAKLRSSTGEDLRLISTIFVSNMGLTEECIHNKLKKNKICGEWFNITENTIKEIFSTLMGEEKGNVGSGVLGSGVLGSGNDIKIDTWKTSYEIYLKSCTEGYNALKEDSKWIENQQKFHPNVDILLSLEKAFTNFWGTEAGWKHKKKSRSKDIDWKSTFTKAIDMNKVYLPRNGFEAPPVKKSLAPDALRSRDVNDCQCAIERAINSEPYDEGATSRCLKSLHDKYEKNIVDEAYKWVKQQKG